MCGIIGYKGKKQAGSILLKGISNLEYRGYDSVGMLTVNNNKFVLRKEVGKVAEADKKLNFKEMNGNIGMAHTRWATSGSVTKINAHPHLSNDSKVAVVHNGIVENYQELRNELKALGVKFISECDTEIFPHYIAYLIKQGKSFKDAVHETLLKVEGSYAIVAVNDSGEMIVARNGSPLVLGIGKDELFAASDVPAFLEYTNKVVYLDDEEYAVLDLCNVNGNSYNIFKVKTNKSDKRQIKTITWTLE